MWLTLPGSCLRAAAGQSACPVSENGVCRLALWPHPLGAQPLTADMLLTADDAFVIALEDECLEELLAAPRMGIALSNWMMMV